MNSANNNANSNKSPFAGGPDWKIEYKNTSKKWEGVYKIWEEGNRERDPKIAQLLYNCTFMTSVQIHQVLSLGKPYSIYSLKKRLNYLSRGSYILKHIIRYEKQLFPVYTIGPGSCIEDIDIDYENNFYKNYSLTKVLKTLTINQLFVRLLESSYAKINNNTLAPYDGEIEYINRSYEISKNRDKINILNVISVRNYDSEYEEIEREINKINKKTIIIASSYESIERIAGNITNNDITLFRFTTDELLFKEPLNSAFYYIDNNNELKREHIDVF